MAPVLKQEDRVETDKTLIFSWSSLDEKMYAFAIRENKAQLYAEQFPTEIFFTMTEEEAEEYGDFERLSDNLKEDFIYFHPTVNGASWWECTCGNFLETDQKGVDRMLKRTVAHARKSHHTIMPRGN